MKLTRIFASMLLLAVCATASFADGVVDVTWNSCTGVTNINTTGGSVLNAYVSVLGQSVTAQSYQVWAYGASAGAGVPDAWRFDAAGCEGPSFFTLNHLAPAAVVKTCPSFQGTQQSLQIKDYSFDPTTNKARIVLANAYPNGGAGNPSATNPAQRYLLANWAFDMTFGVVGPSDPTAGTCGGIEKPFCWALTTTSWLDTNGTEFPWTHGQDFVTVNDALNAQHCPGVVPAASRTWGSLKQQYHN